MLARYTREILDFLIMNSELKAKVIKPNCREKNLKFSCSKCSCAEYDRRDYKILFEAKKLAYFRLWVDGGKEFLCHLCFCNRILKWMETQGLPKINIDLRDGRKKIVMEVNHTENPDDLHLF